MVRVVVVGGGIAGVYFISRLVELVNNAEVVLVEPEDYHFFVVGVPMAFGGLVKFGDLLFPFAAAKKVRHLKFAAKALSLERGKPCVRGQTHSAVCGDYLILAPGGLKLGSAAYWTPSGALDLYAKVTAAKTVRFIVNVFNPAIGFQELAYAVKTRFPEKGVSIHLVYVSPDYDFLLKPWISKAQEAGIAVTRDPPEWREGEFHVSVPEVRPHPLAADLEVRPTPLKPIWKGCT